MAFDLCEPPIGSSFNLTDSPTDDSDDSTESVLMTNVNRFINGQPAQSFNAYNNHLPYSESLKLEAFNYLKQIKANLANTQLLSVHKSHCAAEVRYYISLYGHYFTKEDHILVIKMFLQAMQIPGIEMSNLGGLVYILNSLLRKQRLISPKELTIEWRPLYDIYCKYIFERKSLFQMGQSYGFEANLRGLIEVCRNYFSVDATREILEELRPVQCPFAACKIFRCSFLLGLFLPTQMFPEDHDKGYKLWFDEILSLWSGPNALQYENVFFKLLARLATHNIGYIDWSPYMSTIFTKHTKVMNSSSNPSALALLTLTADCTPVVNWIISMIGGPQSKALEYIEALFKAVESNFHPSNMSRWSTQLTNILSKLSAAFINRLYKERHRKKTWEFQTPKEYQITDEEIDKFVDILQPILLTAMFSRFGSHSVFTSIRDLAWLRPEKVIPPLVEKLYIALDSNLEAHRLNSLMAALSLVAPVMVNGLGRYEEGKTHLISLLFASLPGLDCNDIMKCGYTCGLISHLVDSVPIMDCSSMVDIRNDLTEAEYNIALETARFEEFVLIFLEKVLTLVENYAPEHRPEKIDNDPVKQSSDESYFESSMVFALSIVLTYSSPQIFEKALDKLFIFLRGRLFESRSTIKMMTSVCGLFARANPKIVLDKFLPYLHSTILGLTDNDSVFREDSVDPQLFLALQISAEIIVEGHFLEHSDKILDIIRRGLKLKPSHGYKSAAALIKNCLETLTTVYPNPKNSFGLSWEQLSDFKNINPIRLWGKHDKPEDIIFDWFVPTENEMNHTQKLLDEFLTPELKSLIEWTKGERVLTREEVHRCLHVVLFCTAGSSNVLPAFDSEEYVIMESMVPPLDERVHEIGTGTVYLSDGTNPRQLIAESARKIFKYIIANCDDDTKSLDLIIRIYQWVMGWTKSTRTMKMSRDNYNTVKRNLKNKLLGIKTLPRRIVIERIRLQHEIRVSHKTWGKFTILHRDIVLDLFSLAISHYADVRAKAHNALLHFKHPFGYRLIASELIKVFNKPRTEDTEQIQGALSILLNHQTTSTFMAISDWECVTPLWLALINTDYSEKPTIIALLEQLTKHAANKLQPLLIEFNIGPELFEIGKQCYTTGIIPDVKPPDERAIEQGCIALKQSNQANYDLYISFVHKLVDSIESGQLHWRHLQFAFLLLQSLIRKDIKFPIEGVRIIVKNLINDHIAIRRICINGVAAILKQHKPDIQFHYEPVNLDTDKSIEYEWLYFKPGVDYMDETIWKETKWVNRTYISPNYVPSDGIKYYTEQSAFPAQTLDTVSPEEAVILEFFLDKAKVTKLLDFISLDDKKQNTIVPRRFKMFQGLFRNFGVTLINVFRDFLESMTTETKENVHRCGCDILTGLVRGSKYWPYKDMLAARDLLEPLMKKTLKIVSRETTEVYVEFCMFGFRRLDGRRYSWLFHYLSEDPLSSNDTTATSFQSYSRLKILKDLLITQCWRAIPYLRNLFQHILNNNHLKNPYQNIRQLLGYSLTQLLQFDNDFFMLKSKPLGNAPTITELLNNVLPELEASSLKDHHIVSSGFPSSSSSSVAEPIGSSSSSSSSTSSSASSPMVVVDSSGNTIEDVEKESSNLLTSICYWLHPHLSLNPYITRPQILQLVPIICEIKNRSKDDELKTSANEALNSIGQCSINEKYIDSALDVCKKMTSSKSWHTRVSVVTFIQLMVSSNLFTLMNDKNRNKMVCNMVFDLLQDDRMEVREKAAGLLGGLVHYQFIKIDKHLINKFKVKCARKLTRSTINFGYDSAELNEKHGGALGLCSIVSAYPYDVPEFLPDILMFLSDHLHDPQPIPTTIRKTLSDFKRTHHDNWRQHKEKFNEDQLAIITDLLVSPNYYA